MEYSEDYNKLEKLKEEAKNLGYKLVRINKKEHMIPCKCGCNRRFHISRYDSEECRFYEALKCQKCGETVWGESEKDVIEKWNSKMKKI